MNIYQIFTGRLKEANFRDHKGFIFERMLKFEWQRLKHLGITHVYFLGVFDYRGPVVVNEEEGEDLSLIEDRLPSPFAINNHQLVHPDLGTEKDWLRLVELLKLEGLGVIVDFVPNQTGLDHEWTRKYDDFYLKVDGKPMKDFSGDVLRLDYGNQSLRDAMTEVLDKIVSFGVAGVRCDMAHLAPLDFWNQSISRIKQLQPDFLFIAEAYSENVFNWQPLTDLIKAGFDGVYHEFWYRNLKGFNEGRVDTAGLTEHLNYCRQWNYADKLVHYLANHDDSLPVDKDLIPGLWWLMGLIKGSRLAFNGGLNGLTKRLAHHRLEILPDSYFELKALPETIVKLERWKAEQQPELLTVKGELDWLWGEMMTKDGKMNWGLKMGQENTLAPVRERQWEIVYPEEKRVEYKQGDLVFWE